MVCACPGLLLYVHRHHESTDAATFAACGVDFLKVTGEGRGGVLCCRGVLACRGGYSGAAKGLGLGIVCVGCQQYCHVDITLCAKPPEALLLLLVPCLCRTCEQYDNCYAEDIDIKQRYTDMRDALNKTGRSI